MAKFCEELYEGKCYRPRTIYWHCLCPGMDKCVYIQRNKKVVKQQTKEK